MLGAPSVWNFKIRPTTLGITYEQPTPVNKMRSSSQIKGFPYAARQSPCQISQLISTQARIINMACGQISKNKVTDCPLGATSLSQREYRYMLCFSGKTKFNNIVACLLIVLKTKPISLFTQIYNKENCFLKNKDKGKKPFHIALKRHLLVIGKRKGKKNYEAS